MKRRKMLLFVLLLFCSMAFSQEFSKVRILQLAKQLAIYGYEKESVSALLQAVNFLLDVNPKKVDISTELCGTSSEVVSEKDLDLTPEKIFETVKELAGTDKTFKEWILKTEKRLSGNRGATITPMYDTKFAYGNNGYSISKICFKANEIAEVYISSSNYANLDLYIYDEYGELIASDDSLENDCMVSFYPTYTGPFTIQVKNRASYDASFWLVTN